jgi:hypothetical protein
MAVNVKKKNSAAVTLGRKGGKKGGPARAAKLTPAERSESARKAVQARWAKVKEGSDSIVVRRTTRNIKVAPAAVANTSDHALLTLLKRIKATDNPTEIRQLSSQIERVIFHKQ